MRGIVVLIGSRKDELYEYEVFPSTYLQVQYILTIPTLATVRTRTRTP